MVDFGSDISRSVHQTGGMAYATVQMMYALLFENREKAELGRKMSYRDGAS